ncbi:type 1 glutamine amidotransferase domain-containing protein [Catenisphaera adipataccumulans]|jgi:putative intracellular protease/amidase|uniref:Putative intracellular protease/amidase n=1 Tax=Catenisphaera adipataccumulans TaxID=700500 RepID=A0A7W8CV49_9FIRM|nr:type 1 glutamine amidotransferase domain-containing protein [Catenisphaera adipataccumulans]MBB5182143.1 putative intracellular protease/amidase [Catenisphaera adipataccumulans]
MKKVLMALTNVDHYLEHPERKTGVWLEEAASFYDVLTKNGFEVVFASTNGGPIPIDPASADVSENIQKIVDSEKFSQGMKGSIPFEKIDPKEYAAIYFCGGHGAMWDFPKNEKLIDLAETIYSNGGYIASVCHGEAGLVNLKDADGKPLVQGKKVNGFTNEEEKLNGTDQMVPLSPENELIKDGADFVKGDPYTEFAVEDQRLITGQNPMSVHKVAEMLSAALK